jgi:ATP-dependent protease HslVU (ClpYQ) peptidase subunit
MTCVIGYATKTDAWMASDSASSNDSTIYEAVTPKIIKSSKGLIGSSGSWYVINALDGASSRDSVVEMVLGIRDSPQKEMLDGTEILMVWPGRPLTIINEESAAIELRSPFWAVGSGAEYALGFLAGEVKRLNVDAPPKVIRDMLKQAVEVAAKFCPSVEKPVHIIHISKQDLL